ncbi:CBS domain-containing protein [Halosimplex halobium]|uniref:CBS domain-containing protein n=1 Tax=Halosimplex halobium TaxID=3396618 RepID=UPI003F563C25
MKFFTADDVLSHSTASTPDEPVTVDLDDSIQDALEIMLENDFDQLPVMNDNRVEGTVTYTSIAKFVKSMDDPQVEETTVKIALNTNAEFVDLDHDIFELFETLAEDDYVLLGDRDNLEGILTRYDVFYFLEHQVQPFLKIGEIENALRHLFRESFDDLDQRIEETFADRAEHDDGYEPPEKLEDFSFDEYRMFMMQNRDQLPRRISQEREMVEDLLEDTRDIRNALLHFRAEADEVDRDELDMAHSYFTGIANSI